MIQLRDQHEIGIVNHVHWIVHFGASKRKNRELIVSGEVALRSVSVPIADLVQTAETAAGQIFNRGFPAYPVTTSLGGPPSKLPEKPARLVLTALGQKVSLARTNCSRRVILRSGL